MPIPIELGGVLKWGGVITFMTAVIVWFFRVLKKAERAEVEKIKNKYLEKISAGLQHSLNNGRKSDEKYEKVKSDILNHPDVIDARSLLNSHRYIDGETEKAGQVQ